MHVKRSIPKADRRCLMANDSTSDSDVVEDFAVTDRLANSLAMSTKDTNETFTPAKKSSRILENGRQEAPEPLPETHEVELQLLAIETRRLDFAVAQWKQQQMLRLEALQLKREEIKLKEVTTKQQQHTHVMELKAGILQALDQTGQPLAQARKFLALLEG